MKEWGQAFNKIQCGIQGNDNTLFSPELVSVDGATMQSISYSTQGDWIDLDISITSITTAPSAPIVVQYNGKTIFAATLYANNVISVSDGVNVDLPTSQIQQGYRRYVVNGNATSNDRELHVKCYETFDTSNLQVWGNTQITGATFAWQGTTLIVRYTMTNQTAQGLDSLYITKGEDTFLSVYCYANTFTTDSYGIWNYSTMPPVKVYP